MAHMADRTPGRSARQRKRRTAARVVHRARTVSDGLRWAQNTARRHAWKARQKWTDESVTADALIYLRQRAAATTPQERRMCGKE